MPVELVAYPRSTHDLSRTGEPWLLVDRLERAGTQPRLEAAGLGLQQADELGDLLPGDAPVDLLEQLARGRCVDRDVVRDEDSFVSLEGDSLSYVEMSIRVEEVLGHLPPSWHVTPIGELEARQRLGRPALEIDEGDAPFGVLLRDVTHTQLGQ